MASVLAGILKNELASQRIFLSSDEERALTYPMSYADEDDLAWDRIRHRRTFFFPMLRTYYIREHRPTERWKGMIVAEEAEAGEQTFISQMARQVLEWEATTSDRGAMAVGFAAKTMTWLGVLLALLGAYAYFNGGQIPGAIVVGIGLLFLLAGRVCGGYAAKRVAALTREASLGLGGQAAAGT
jgi:hypothetical protein